MLTTLLELRPDPPGVLESVLALALLVPAAYSDIRTGRIPNLLTLSGAGAGFTFALASGALLSAILAAVAGAGVLLSVRALGQVLYSQPGMGWGDVKLGGALGLIVGWDVLGSLFVAALVGSVVGLALTRRQRRQIDEARTPTRIVFAPFVLAGWIGYGWMALHM